MNAAKLRNRMTIQVPVRIRGTQGSFSVAWAALRDIYCQLQPVSSPDMSNSAWRAKRTGVERNFANKSRATISHVITCRTQQEWLTPDMRLVEDILQFNKPVQRVFNIVECLMLENIRNEMRLEVWENISDKDSGLTSYVVGVDDTGSTMTDDTGEYGVALA